MGGPLNLPSKPFKVNSENKKIGVVASNFQELIKKCSSKFKMDEESITIKLEDGTEVDDEYFEVLESNEELFIGGRQSPIFLILGRLESFLYEYMKNLENVDNGLQDILQNKNTIKMIQDLASLNNLTSKCQENLRLEDPNWFEGIDKRYHTKQEVLRASAENRMRGYLQKFKKDFDFLKKTDVFQYLLDSIQQKLKNRKYNAAYFDRSALNERLCDEKGLFTCFGEFLRVDCPHLHQINPYNSREERILFSTWNFDHVVEMSRSIIPTVKAAVGSSDSILLIDADYLFELIFEHRTEQEKETRGNLKLVHIVCHNKNPHKLDCDKKRLFTQSEKPSRKKIKLS